MAVVHSRTLVKRHGHYISVRSRTQYRRTGYKRIPFTITSKEEPRCPYCGALLEFEDHVRRHRKLAGGEKEWFWIERRSCPACWCLHRVLPDFLAPYKHYDIGIITGVLNGEITSDLLAFEDYPCERTMERWQDWMILNLIFINAYLKSVGIRLFAFGIALAYAAADLVEELNGRTPHGWLKTIIRAIYNTGASLEPYRDHPG